MLKDYIKKFKNSFVDQHLQIARDTIDNENFISDNLIKSLIHNNLIINNNYNCLIGTDTYSDVEFFNSYKDKDNINFDKYNTVFKIFSENCNLSLSEIILKEILLNPNYNIINLQNRQNILINIEKNNNYIELIKLLQELKEYEKDIIWLFNAEDDNLKDLYNMIYFKFTLFKPLNKYSSCLTAFNFYRILLSPLIGLLSPLIYFIIPYFVIKIKFKIKLSFINYMKILFNSLTTTDIIFTNNFKSFRILSYLFSMLFYFQGLFNSVEISRTLYKINRYITNKMRNISIFLIKANKINQIYWNENIKEFFINSKLINNLENDNNYVNTLHNISFSLLTNFGKQLYNYLVINKNSILSILNKIYILDSLNSCLIYKNNNKLNYTQYVDNSNLPFMKIEGLYHPCLQNKSVVKNDILLGNNIGNIIITGPNAGGKSTLIKSLIINVLLAQTIGFSNSNNSKITPYYNISTQINIPDDKGYESLFEAEMYRCKNKLELLKVQDKNKFTFLAMDEIFNSTNPIEGIAGAYAIAKKISEYSNTNLIFTTHYSYLTKLSKLYNFTNFKMNIIKNNNIIIYPYKITKGVSNQYIALELLKLNNFDNDIIEEALLIKNKLTNKTKNI